MVHSSRANFADGRDFDSPLDGINRVVVNEREQRLIGTTLPRRGRRSTQRVCAEAFRSAVTSARFDSRPIRPHLNQMSARSSAADGRSVTLDSHSFAVLGPQFSEESVHVLAGRNRRHDPIPPEERPACAVNRACPGMPGSRLAASRR